MSDNPVSAPYWEAAQRHEFVIQRCKSCSAYVFPPRPVCPVCGVVDLEWVPASGKGTVYSYTIARRPTHPRFADRVPYVIAIVELAEGPRLSSNIVGCAPDDVRIGTPVTVTFEETGDRVLPVFEVAQ